MGKTFIDLQALLQGSFELGLRVYESGFRPTFIVGVWRGGAPIAMVVQEIFEKLGCRADHAAIKASSYHGADTEAGRVEVSGIDTLAATLTSADRVLIVDDIFDTGRSLKAILDALHKACASNLPQDIRTAALYYKPLRNKTMLTPDYHLIETDDWVVFPHELLGCSEDELAKKGVLPQRFFEYLKQAHDD